MPVHCRMRGFDRDLIRGGHYGQRSCEPHLKAEHMAAPTNAANVKKALANSEPSTHGTKRRLGNDRCCAACGGLFTARLGSPGLGQVVPPKWGVRARTRPRTGCGASGVRLTLPNQLPRGADQHGDGSASSNGFCRIAPVLEGVLISLRCARRRSAVHPASAVRHRRRLAPAPASASALRIAGCRCMGNLLCMGLIL